MWAVFYYPLLSVVCYIALTIVFFLLAHFLPKTQILSFIARILSSYGSLIFCATYGVVASLTLRALSLHRLAQWTTARSFDLVMRYTTGVRFIIIDDGDKLLSSKRPMVIIGNHQTELDVLFLGRIFPKYCSVTAKKSLKRTPFLGWFMSLSGTVFIDRVDRSQAMKAFEGAAKEMKEHRQSVFIFPEGTRSYARQPMLLPFKKGAFHLAVQAGVDILPVVAENYSKVLDVKAMRFNSGIIRVKVLPLISTIGMTAANVDDLTRDTREKMLNMLEVLAKDPHSKSGAPSGSGSGSGGSSSSNKKEL